MKSTDGIVNQIQASVKLISIAIVGSIVGVSLALLFPWEIEAATVDYDVDVHPGTGSGNDVTCGWHGTCDINGPNWAAGDGLDLESGNNVASYFRTWGFRNDTYTVTTIGSGVVTELTTGCKKINVAAKDHLGSARGNVRFTHQDDPGSNLVIGGTIPGNWDVSRVSRTILVSEERTGCTITNPHLHEANASGFSKTGGYNTAIKTDAKPMYSVDLTSQNSNPMLTIDWTITD